jgi:hypothetical protein
MHHVTKRFLQSNWEWNTLGRSRCTQYQDWSCSMQREDSYRRGSLNWLLCSRARGQSDSGKTTRSRDEFKRATSVGSADYTVCGEIKLALLEAR